ncbi:MAG: hypothetical protein JOZ25_00215 [Actinobacteria bacterium]|nr:hypothetical protein [Actinomycetota bacterium]
MSASANEARTRAAEELSSPLEQRIARSFEDDGGAGRPLSRRARQTKRTVEAYLGAGGVPRYMERLREIDAAIAVHARRIERAYRRLQAACAGDAELFARRWRAQAARWRFEELNDLIRQHNEWYPVETRLPMDPRTGDYVRRSGRSYRRPVLGPEWVLERFPAG